MVQVHITVKFCTAYSCFYQPTSKYSSENLALKHPKSFLQGKRSSFPSTRHKKNYRRFKPSWITCCVIRQTVFSISEDHNAFVFRVKQGQEALQTKHLNLYRLYLTLYISLLYHKSVGQVAQSV